MRYASIRNMDVSNGEGVGVALFVQGCNFHCYNCFNKDTWDFNGGHKWTPEIKEQFLKLIDRPYIKRVSILGGEPLADENLEGVLDLVSEINKRYNAQQDIVPVGHGEHNILDKNGNKIRLLMPEKTIWLYTGYEFSYLIWGMDKWDSSEISTNKKRKAIIEQCNVVVDGRYIDSLRDISLKWKGSSNQNVIDVNKSVINERIVLW